MLSIIIPALNEADRIRDTLRPLQAARAAGHELILVDGGSTDGTAEAARPLVDSVVTAPRGRARQMNAGAAVASGDVLWFVHADCGVQPESYRAVDEAVSCGVVWGRFDVRLSGDRRLLRLVEFFMNHRSRLTGIATGDQGMFVRRDTFRRVGGFPDISLMEDIALSTALRRLARPACVRGPLVTSSRRWERDGIWRTILLMWRLRLRYWLGADPAELHRQYYGRR